MKDQVTSIEQSKRLIELGVPAGKASMVWIPGYEFDALTRRFIPNDKECFLSISYDRSSLMGDNIVAAFTVADIMELLPMFIERKGTFYLNITPCYEGWYAGYETEKGSELTSYRGPKLVDVLMAATEWLLSNGYKLNI